MQSESEKFPGFPVEMRKNFWMFPRVLDKYTHLLSGSESRVLVFVLRRTWGFQKTSDTMSIQQIASGGGKIGTGTGLSPRQIITALHGLEKKGFITIRKRRGWTSEYSLVQEVPTSHENTANSDAGSAHQTNATTASTIDSNAIDKIKRIYELYTHYIRPGGRVTQEARINIANRFTEYRPEELVAAMKNVREHDYWGNIARANTIAWFFASEQRIDTFLALGPHEAKK